MLTSTDRVRRPLERARLSDVAAWIDGWAAAMPAEDVALAQAAGRVLAHGLAAPLDLPPFDRAAADGFALRADETVGASAYSPMPFKLGQAPAGSGVAVAVASGDPLPAGADAVVRPEHAMPEAPGIVAAIAPVFAGSDVERQGSQARRGDALLPPGRRLDAGDIGVLAGAGMGRIAVVARPRVRCILLPGRAVEAGRTLAAGEIYDANGPLLAALIARDGGAAAGSYRVGSGLEAVREALRTALEAGADVVLVAGGTGSGAGDHAAAALAEAGALAVHGVALRPGETAGAGRAGGVPVFLLPGPPPDCLWAYELIAGRAIRRLAGLGPELPHATQTLRAARKIVSEVGTVEVCPVRLAGGEAVPVPSFAEAGLAAGAHADGFVLVPEASEGYPQGGAVTVYLRRRRPESVSPGAFPRG